MANRIIFLCSLWMISLNMVAAEINVVDQAMEDLGVDVNERTDPEIMLSILTNDMFLIELPGIMNVLGADIKKPQAMRPMLQKIRESLLKDHPGIVKFLEQAHARGMLKKVDAVVLKRLLNHMFLLEIIVNRMKDDKNFMIAVNKAFIAKRESYGIAEGKLETFLGVYRNGGGVFGGAKAITMDGVLRMYGDIRERGAMEEHEIVARVRGLKLNISEAYATDAFHRHLDNVVAGVALNMKPPSGMRVMGDEVRVQYLHDQAWTSLYETWNLAFIIGCLDNLHLLLPKLLIPAVLCADPNDYLFMRSLALWVSLNFSLFAKAAKRPNVMLPGAQEIAILWGQINRDEATRYLATQNAGDKADTFFDAVLMQKPLAEIFSGMKYLRHFEWK